MRLKLIVSLALTLATYSTIKAQKIKLKKETVFVDGNPTFEYKKQAMATQCSIYRMDTKEEILFIKGDNNGTLHYHDDDFTQITFIKSKKKLESKSLNVSYKGILQQLISNKVLDLEGNINLDKLETFFAKYDENITNRSSRF